MPGSLLTVLRNSVALGTPQACELVACREQLCAAYKLTTDYKDMGVSQNYGYLFGGPHNKDYSILGSILVPLILGNYHIDLLEKLQIGVKTAI